MVFSLLGGHEASGQQKQEFYKYSVHFVSSKAVIQLCFMSAETMGATGVKWDLDKWCSVLLQSRMGCGSLPPSLWEEDANGVLHPPLR